MKNFEEALRKAMEDFKRRYLVAGGDIYSMGLPVVTLTPDNKGNLIVTEIKNPNTNGSTN